MKTIGVLRGLKSFVHRLELFEEQKLLIGRLLAEEVKKKNKITSLSDVEFKVFSQWGDDGIIQFLINNIKIPNKTFVEFGVGNYRESNTRFLLMNDNWSGFVMDASEKNIDQIRHSKYYWRYELEAKTAFITTENINTLIMEEGYDENLGLLHIDIDGNDYWIWKELESLRPVIVILEYNSVFGSHRPITIPYDKNFQRTTAHFSNLYYGSSLCALYYLGKKKGYAFVGSNSAGNNAYFVRKDKLNHPLKEVSLEEGYVLSKFRESRNKNGVLTYASGAQRTELIKGMPVFNVETSEIEQL